MRCTLGSFCGWLTLEIEFDPVVINQERAAELALSAHGLCPPGGVHVVNEGLSIYLKVINISIFQVLSYAIFTNRKY
jgi:hypothetical protein